MLFFLFEQESYSFHFTFNQWLKHWNLPVVIYRIHFNTHAFLNCVWKIDKGVLIDFSVLLWKKSAYKNFEPVKAIQPLNQQRLQQTRHQNSSIVQVKTEHQWTTQLYFSFLLNLYLIILPLKSLVLIFSFLDDHFGVHCRSVQSVISSFRTINRTRSSTSTGISTFKSAWWATERNF